MTVFVDSSALVTRYIPEPLSVSIVGETIVLSAITRVEVPSALWRRVRMGELPAEVVAELATRFEIDSVGTVDEPPRFTFVAVSDHVLAVARQLTATRGLTALDAIQLATAIVVRDADPDCDTVAVLDRRLRDAVAAEGFRLLPSSS